MFEVAFQRINDEVTDLAAVTMFARSDDELVVLVEQAGELVSRLSAVQALAVRELARRNYPRRHGAASPAIWLRQQTRVSMSQARPQVKLGDLLDARPMVAAAVLDGSVNVDQATVVGDTITSLRVTVADLDSAPPDLLDRCETALLGFASELDANALRAVGERILAHVAPELAEQALRKAVERDERRGVEQRSLSLRPDGTGLWRLSGRFGALDAATIQTTLAPLCRPRSSGTGHSETGQRDSGGRGDSGQGDSGQGDSSRGERGDRGGEDRWDRRTGPQRFADALVEVCARTLAGGTLPAHGGVKPQVNITCDIDTLTRQLGVGILDTGGPISATEVRRLACDASILPAVMSGAGAVLDVGLRQRLFTGSIRRALILRDRGCAFPGCDRPPEWCDGHHIRHHADGGPTCLSNGVLLCAWHHRLLHDDNGWEVFIDPADQLPSFRPPMQIDPLRRPTRNILHRLRH